ncbi:MAG: ATP-binding protein [Caldilinea sp. CFX5]|nr:ATP-binding protein [Caldilinea sp. CFX5]
MTELTLQEIQAQAAAILKTMDTSYRAVEPQVLYSRYHQAAAVLTTFTPDTLQPAPGAANSSDLAQLLQDSTAVGGVAPVRYVLREEVRREVLRELGSRTAMLAALQANPARPTDATQTMLELYLQGKARPLEAQNAKEIAGTYQVVQWLDGLIDGLPPLSAVQQRWEMLDLLHTFDVLAGVKFRGREAELALLHSYLLAPSADGSRRPPLVFYGPGGVGKSALLARFIQDLVERPSAQAAPWSYIDFDRPGIDPEEPLTIIIEVLRQLGIQYPAQRQYIERFRKGLQDDLLKRVQITREVTQSAVQQAVIGKGERQEDWWSYLGNFASLLFSLGAGDQPYLLALDTFEEVQYRSSAVVQRLFRFLQALQEQMPMTRPVLAGRNPVVVPGFTVENHELNRFQPEAAQALLEGEGMPATLAQTIVKQIGTSPLSLRLALDLWQRGQTNTQGLTGVAGDDLLFEIQEGQIEGVLFARILEHIHAENKDVGPLVHPGLVLRRITPEIIRKVLAKHCGIKVRDEAQADDLFDKLAREEALVNLEGRVLRHRADVRIIMVRLLRRTKRDTIKKIEEAAVRYYSQQENPEARAEEIYHRLALQQSLRLISERWVDAEKRGWTEQMRRLLFSARDELEPRQRAWLADKLGFELTPEEEAQADQQTWEHEAEKRARHELEDNYAEGALTTIYKRPQWLPGSPLYLLALQAYELLGNWEAAAEVAERGIQSAAEKGDRSLAVLLRLRAVRLDLQRNDLTAARQQLDSAEKLVQGSRDVMRPLQLLEIGLYRLVTARQASDERSTNAALISLLAAFDQIPNEVAQRDPALLAALATEVGRQQPPVLARVLRLIGLPANPEVENELIVALAEWDQRVATAAGAAPGLLARQLGATAGPNATLSQIWRAFLAERKPAERGAALSQLLTEHTDVPGAVLAASTKAMSVRAGERAFTRISIPTLAATARAVAPSAEVASSPSSTQSDRLRPDGQRLTSKQVKQFSAALSAAFTLRDLDEMLYSRLDKRLETIAFSDDLPMVVFRVIERAEREGWGLDLLLAARAARPDSPQLGALADELGVGSITADQSALQSFLAKTSRLNFTAWRSQLGRLETQVCRIEIGDRVNGTGFLLGPDLIMTATDAIADLVAGTVRPEAVTCRFDYQAAADGRVVNGGALFALDSIVHLWRDPTASFGYALLRLTDKSGYTTIGSSQVESTATLRNWIAVPDPAPTPAPGSALFILHYDDHGRLRLTHAQNALLSLDSRGERLSYRLTPGRVAVGAPCFDAHWNLVALHLGEQAETGYGLSLNAIAHDLAVHGYALRSLQEGIR